MKWASKIQYPAPEKPSIKDMAHRQVMSTKMIVENYHFKILDEKDSNQMPTSCRAS